MCRLLVPLVVVSFCLLVPVLSGDVTKYTPVEIKVPSGRGSSKLQVAVSNRGEVRASNPREIMAQVTHAWDQVVEKNQVLNTISFSSVMFSMSLPEHCNLQMRRGSSMQNIQDLWHHSLSRRFG